MFIITVFALGFAGQLVSAQYPSFVEDVVSAITASASLPTSRPHEVPIPIVITESFAITGNFEVVESIYVPGLELPTESPESPDSPGKFPQILLVKYR
jgi:hypothetical protein